MFSSFIICACLIVVSFGQNQDDDCPPNEVLDECAGALCRNQECILIGKPIACASVASCQSACVCQVGFLRTYNGTCIPEEKCEPQPCPGVHELYSPKKSACQLDTCESLATDYKCDENQISEPGCVCELGYVRKNKTAPCDVYMCDCPQMTNTAVCGFGPPTIVL